MSDAHSETSKTSKKNFSEIVNGFILNILTEFWIRLLIFMVIDCKDFWETIYKFQYSVATRVPACESMKSLYFCKALIWKLEKIYRFLLFHLAHLIGVSWTSFNAPRVVRRNGYQTSKMGIKRPKGVILYGAPGTGEFYGFRERIIVVSPSTVCLPICLPVFLYVLVLIQENFKFFQIFFFTCR